MCVCVRVGDYLARWLLNDHLLDLGIKMGNHIQIERTRTSKLNIATAKLHRIRNQSTSRRVYHTQLARSLERTHAHTHARISSTVRTFSYVLWLVCFYVREIVIFIR